MSKLLAGVSAVALIAASSALAQTTPQNDSATNPPSASERMDKAPAAESRDSTIESKGAMGDKSAEVTSTGMRASKLIGATVYNSANESIGDINDLIFHSDGRIASAIVGVGGFLGMGERNVALEFSQLQVNHNADDDSLKVSAEVTKQFLESMPEWKAPAAAK